MFAACPQAPTRTAESAAVRTACRERPVELYLEPIREVTTAAEGELRLGAIEDRDRCCGYFRALAGMSRIRTEAPASRAFAQALPTVFHAGLANGLNSCGCR